MYFSIWLSWEKSYPPYFGDIAGILQIFQKPFFELCPRLSSSKQLEYTNVQFRVPGFVPNRRTSVAVIVFTLGILEPLYRFWSKNRRESIFSQMPKVKTIRGTLVRRFGTNPGTRNCTLVYSNYFWRAQLGEKIVILCQDTWEFLVRNELFVGWDHFFSWFRNIGFSWSEYEMEKKT